MEDGFKPKLNPFAHGAKTVVLYTDILMSRDDYMDAGRLHGWRR